MMEHLDSKDTASVGQGVVQNVRHDTKSPIVLVGTYNRFDTLAHEPTGEVNTRGIEVFTMVDGLLTPLTNEGAALDIVNPAFILKHHSRNDIFFVSTERIDENGEILTLRLDESGRLSILARRDSGGKSTCYLTLHPDGKFLTAVHYWNAKLHTFPIDEQGILGEPICSCQQGNGHYADSSLPGRVEHWMFRQKWSHAHCAVIEPYTRQYMFVCDLGQDKIFVYPLYQDSASGPMTPVGDIQLPNGVGPRHLVFHPDVKTAYVVNELVSSVTVLKLTNTDQEVPSMSGIQSLSTLPVEWQEKKTTINGVWKATSHCSEIRLHPSGNFLYVGNRGHESIVIYKIDKDNDGMLEQVDIVSTAGKCPRNFNFAADGTILVVGNQNTNTLVNFNIDLNSGKLSKAGVVACHSPNYVCVL